ncbi:MAG: hypothetical protein P1P65_07000 [Treponema sp.]
MYFDSVEWENTDDLTLTPLPQAYTIEKNNPVPYADTIDDGDLYPSVPQLGILEYQNIAEDLLVFFDGVSASLIKKSFEPALFAASKPFLPHLAHFILERLPDISVVFYSRPVLNRAETASARFRLTTVTEAAAPQDAAADQDVQEEEAQKPDGAAKMLTLFDKDDLPIFIIIELSAVKEDGAWKISSIDIRGAEYADSADSD